MNDFFDQNKLIASVLFVVAVVLLRWIIVRYIQKKQFSDQELVSHWLNTITNVAQLIVAVGLIIIWLSELQYAMFSVAAFIVAIVIAMREFIQNFLGSLYLASTRTFSIGDWIEINGSVGEVARSDWLSTTMLEVDVEGKTYAYTGKTLVIPNNQFVAGVSQNFNFLRRYVNHSFSIVREADVMDLSEFKPLVLEKAEEYCSSFMDVAERYNSSIESKLGKKISGPEASVRLRTTNLGKNEMIVSFFCPTEQALSIEQKITEDFMRSWYAKLKALQTAE